MRRRGRLRDEGRIQELTKLTRNEFAGVVRVEGTKEGTHAPGGLASHLTGFPIEIRHELAHHRRSVALAGEGEDKLETGMIVNENQRVVMPAAGPLEGPDRVAVDQTAGIGRFVA